MPSHDSALPCRCQTKLCITRTIPIVASPRRCATKPYLTITEQHPAQLYTAVTARHGTGLDLYFFSNPGDSDSIV